MRETCWNIQTLRKGSVRETFGKVLLVVELESRVEISVFIRKIKKVFCPRKRVNRCV